MRIEKKDCVFQYALPSEIIEDTMMITREDGDRLWEKYKVQFLEHMKEGRDPEMVLWTEMKSPTDFRKSARHWHAADMIILNGELYQRVCYG